ncbi:MAG TPA: hypothetical protein VK464_07735 [Symbiobacteriaceae bacterium]|jgi:hypothetical protein|nr:hypothetical protein [Symbiobacteriaceae bacterium]
MELAQEIGRGIVVGATVALSRLATHVLIQHRRRTRWWITKSPFQRTVLLILAVIWVIVVAALFALVLFFLGALVLDLFSRSRPTI